MNTFAAAVEATPVIRIARLAAAALLVTLATSQLASATNFLVIVADDLGVDALSTYASHPQAAPTPNITAIAADGVLFRAAWANPICTPSRVAILTGMFVRTSDITRNPGPVEGGLDADQTTIADLAQAAGYSTFAVGKWHLTPETWSMTAPLGLGFDHHAGSRSSLESGGYSDWEKFVDGVSIPNHSVYATTDTTDEALGFIGSASEPWFAYVAYNAPHRPFHAPPPNLHSYDLSGTTPESDPELHYRAAVEAMDTEIGRLIAGIAPAELANTVIVFVGDNGTPAEATLAPYDPVHAKGTAYEGGVHVPLVVAGAAVDAAQKGSEVGAIVHVADLFGTIQELGSFSPNHRATDSVSLVPYLAAPGRTSLRRWMVGERDSSTGLVRAATNGCYKLLKREGLEFYDLCDDPLETNDLMGAALLPTQQAGFQALSPYLFTTPACDNNIDDDGDGAIDFGGSYGTEPDSACAGLPSHDSELLPEPSGFDLLPLATLAFLARKRRKRRTGWIP